MKFYFAATLAFVAMSAALPAPTPARAQVAITITAVLPPPALPDYDQPPCPAMGYIWAPGYWAWDGDDYYWVAGAWVLPPAAGLLWTPVY